MIATPRSPRRILLAFLACLLLIYVADFALFELRVLVPRLGPALGSVHRLRILAIARNGNKVEFQVDAIRPEEDLPCARSLFPHAGANPCWYVTRHASDPIPM